MDVEQLVSRATLILKLLVIAGFIVGLLFFRDTMLGASSSSLFIFCSALISAAAVESFSRLRIARLAGISGWVSFILCMASFFACVFAAVFIGDARFSGYVFGAGMLFFAWLTILDWLNRRRIQNAGLPD